MNSNRYVTYDRPSTYDESGTRLFLYPAKVRGRYRELRDWIYLFLIIVFIALPWTKFNGHQTILLDIPNRKFAFFGVTFWAHDVPMVFFILALLSLGLFIVTSIWGRVWCGWACPQTVFIDRLYRRIEYWIEGSHTERKKLDEGPWTSNKIKKKAIKWFLFWFVSTNIAHSFTAYFIGAERLLAMSITNPLVHWVPFLFVTSTTLILLFNFGWFREQFCMIVCPYGRFQSVLMDQHSMAVLYDEKRGEPRKAKGLMPKETGDCIDCYKCVAVCPTGIDIRRGVQMECISCTACIDACDEVMEKIKKPKGLIKYASLSDINKPWKTQMTKRRVTYLVLFSLVLFSFVYVLSTRKLFDAKFIRAIETPYTEVKKDNGASLIVNHYRVHLKNHSFNEQIFYLKIFNKSGEPIEIVAPTFPLKLKGGSNDQSHIFFKFSKFVTSKEGKKEIEIEIRGSEKNELIRERIILVGPVGSES